MALEKKITPVNATDLVDVEYDSEEDKKNEQDEDAKIFQMAHEAPRVNEVDLDLESRKNLKDPR